MERSLGKSLDGSAGGQLLAHSAVVRLSCEDQTTEVVLDLTKQLSNDQIREKFAQTFRQPKSMWGLHFLTFFHTFIVGDFFTS
jgi:hypothetical protein